MFIVYEPFIIDLTHTPGQLQDLASLDSIIGQKAMALHGPGGSVAEEIDKLGIMI